ncbi:MAG: hypothetical protein JJE40_01875 [Vicinamibacteria bacterium]|nr:hypothetical protein [Vicinamibacteria bacterium]
MRTRLHALATFSHPMFAKVRALTTLDDPIPQLALVSELVAGERLSTVLRAAEARGARLDSTSAIWLLRHLLPALASFHEATGGAQHRLLDADRIVLTPTGEIAITEYVFGGLSEDMLPSPRTNDVGQAALLAVVILLGRPLRADELDPSFERLVQHACATSPSADVLRPWLTRALTLGPDRFKSAQEAYHALDELLPGVWGSRPAVPELAGQEVSTAVVPAQPQVAPTTWPQRALPAAPSTVDSVSWRRLKWANGTLAGIATIEAVCIVLLIWSGVMSSPAAPPLPQRLPPVQAATLAPTISPMSAWVMAELDPAAVAPVGTALNDELAHYTAPNSVIGWLVVDSGVEVKVYVNGRLLGVATRGRFRVPAGDHIITLVNNALNFRSSQTVSIVAGRSVLVAAKPPQEP